MNTDAQREQGEKLSAPEAAKLLDVHRSTVLRYEREGRLKATERIGKMLVFSSRDVEALATELEQEREAVETGKRPRPRGWMPGERRKAA